MLQKPLYYDKEVQGVEIKGGNACRRFDRQYSSRLSGVNVAKTQVCSLNPNPGAVSAVAEYNFRSQTRLDSVAIFTS